MITLTLSRPLLYYFVLSFGSMILVLLALSWVAFTGLISQPQGYKENMTAVMKGNESGKYI